MSVPLFVSERLKPEPCMRPLSVGCLIFEQMDQIDFTGPFEVLSRMPDTTVQIIGKYRTPIRDVQGLQLTPDTSIAEAGTFDVLLVPEGHGQQALMHNEEVLEIIRMHVQRGKLLFSVCTGALLCGAAGVLRGRQVTTHWSARHLMPYYGALLADARVVVDGNIVSAAGVAAGLDAALVVVSLLKGEWLPRRFSWLLSMRRIQCSIVVLQIVRPLRSCGASRRSTNRSGLQGGWRRSATRQMKQTLALPSIFPFRVEALESNSAC